MAQTRYQRHHEDHILHHAKRTIGELVEELHTYPFDRLVLGGPSEAVSLLERHLPRPLLDRLSGTVSIELFASDSTVLEATLEVMEAIERQVELKEVKELLDAAATRGAALGFEATLEALNQGRVHRLLIARQFMAAGGECARCGRLVAGAAGCSSCGGRTRAVPDFGERLVEQAMDQGGKIEFVSGEAATLLMTFDGLGAWTRY